MVVVARSCCQASAKQGSQGQALLVFDVHNLWTSKMLIAHGVIVVLLLKHRVLTWIDRIGHLTCNRNNAETFDVRFNWLRSLI